MCKKFLFLFLLPSNDRLCFDQSMLMGVFVWIFYKTSGVLYMMLQLYSPLSRWSILCLLIFFLKKFCFSSMASPKPWCLHFIEFQTQTWVIYVFTWVVVPLCTSLFLQQKMWPLLKLAYHNYEYIEYTFHWHFGHYN